jgi:RNA-directed DNA polymerase
VRWIRNKYKRLRGVKKARQAYTRATKRYPGMFRHWRYTPAAW